MKRKYYFVILFFILAIFLSGCSGGGIVTPANDEAQIRNLISNFCVAVSNGDLNLAQSYYYPGSTTYLALEQFENLYNSYPQQTEVTLSVTPTIYSVYITGNEATVLVSFYTQVCYQGECTSVSSEKQTRALIKSSGKWYLL
jgi:spore coat protein CotH